VSRGTALVTGAFGFIGRHLARDLARDGWKVHGIGHGAWTGDEASAWGVSDWRQETVTLETLLVSALVPDLIVHCAGTGSVAPSFSNPHGEFRRTVGSTCDVLEFMRQAAPASRLLLTSSASVYGEPSEIPIPETARLAPVSPYGMFKKASEDVCAAYTRHFGLQVSVLRLFSIYGAGLRKQFLWDACRKLSAGDTIFNGTGLELRDWLVVSDLSALVAQLARAAPGQGLDVLNVGSGHATAVGELLGILADALGVGRAKLQFSGVALPGNPHALVADIGRAQSAGWAPRTSLLAGAQDYVDWYKRDALGA
jgi:UDP-glucose 4-epimerase